MKIEKKEHMEAYVIHTIANIGSNIKTARERRGLSVEKLAEISFCNVGIIESIENGDVDAKFSNIVRVLASLYMDGDIEKIACPGSDEVGVFLSRYYTVAGDNVDKFDF